jgi:hypothetical protein
MGAAAFSAAASSFLAWASCFSVWAMAVLALFRSRLGLAGNFAGVGELLLRIAASGAFGIKRLLGLRRLCSGLGGCLFSSGHFGGQCGITGFGGEFLLGCSDGVLSVSAAAFLASASTLSAAWISAVNFGIDGLDVLGGLFPAREGRR